MLRVFNNASRYVDQGGNKVCITYITCFRVGLTFSKKKKNY